MAELAQSSPCAGLLPLTLGAITVEERLPGTLTTLSAFAPAEMAAALKQAHGVDWPAPNRAVGKDGARSVWFGHREVLLMGPHPDPGLAAHGAVVDVTDGWAVVQVQGYGVEDMLARLVPVDVRARTFKRGHAARTMIGHMNGCVIRVGADAFLLLVFRSMAQTLVHELKRAMENTQARL